MKTHKSASTTKLVARFDKELKGLLLSDLKNLRGVHPQFIQSKHPGARTSTLVSRLIAI
jgi:hypothetical protein